jgi:hypothetical protein
MVKYQYFLRKYLDNRQISLLSMSALPSQYHDAAGFSGIQLNDEFANVFLYNQCLLQTKSQSDVQRLLFLKINQFLLPSTDLLSSTKTKKKTAKGTEEKEKSILFNSLLAVENALRKQKPDSAKPKIDFRVYTSYAATSHSTKLTTTVSTATSAASAATAFSCGFQIPSVYGITDKTDSFPFGPSDYSFFKGIR